jgi:hypothetical protein
MYIKEIKKSLQEGRGSYLNYLREYVVVAFEMIYRY